MISALFKLVILIAVLGGSSIITYSQPPLFPDASTASPRGRRDDSPLGFKDMLARQRVEREKKDYEELLERGDEALKLTKLLEASFEQNNGFSQQDRARLESLEKIVTKIRKGLGGDDDDDESSKENANSMRSDDEPRPSTLEEAFQFLRSTTVKMVDELKRTTRFSISAVAIQSSNTVLKLVKFLRLKK